MKEQIGEKIAMLELFINYLKIMIVRNALLELILIKIHVNVNVFKITNALGQEVNGMTFLIVLVGVKIYMDGVLRIKY